MDPEREACASVLVTAAGSIVAQGIIKSLKLANNSDSSAGARNPAPGKGRRAPVHYKITAADMSPLAAGLYRCDSGVLVPPASSPDYVDAIISICKSRKISAVYVGSDDELLTLAGEKERIEHESGARLLAGPAGALDIARDKWKTFEFCRQNGLPCTPSALAEDLDQFIKEYGFPVAVKPREGYGSLHFYVAGSREDAERASAAIRRAGWRPVFQKFLPGEEEFTSGVTVDRAGRRVMSSISIRKTIKHGQTYKAFIDDFYSVRKSAEQVALKLGAAGPVNVQAKLEKDGTPVLFEINPRFSATCPMRAAAGVNEPDIVYRNAVLGEEVERIDGYEKLVCMRYWNEVYVPHALYGKLADKRAFEKKGTAEMMAMDIVNVETEDKKNPPVSSFLLDYF